MAADLAREVKALGERRGFGLNFERHTPEIVELPGRPVRKGDKVRFLAERGASPKSVDRRLWRVVAVTRTDDGRVATLVRQDRPDSEQEATTRAIDDLVVVAEFGDPIYPGLVSTGKVERGEGKPFHTVINAENFHALQTLLYTHEGKVDVIYLDPPYNTGARDWKYNNDYVDADDAYRHSKWLAFMERRLKMAKRLLNPGNSVLIITIDEKEVHRLGLLLGQVFPQVPMQMITTVINPKGASLGRDFARVDEQIFVLYFGAAGVRAQVRDMLDERKNEAPDTSVKWSSLIRGGAQGVRTDSPGAYYPVFIDPVASRIHSFGEALPWGQSREDVPVPSGTVAVWPPTHTSGVEGRWGIGPDKARELLALGALRLGAIDVERGKFPLSYLSSGIMKQVASGEIITEGRRADGTLIVRYPSNTKVTQPKTVWKMPGHNAGEYGSKLLSAFLPGRKFPFPKALYAVEDILRFFVADKPNALVVDFFAGSGTTAHAVMRLNRQDSGSRRTILVTNNEVSAMEQVGLTAKGLRPGELDWEALGICDYITKPRLRAVVTGLTPDGKPVEGDYKFTDEFPMSEGMEENVEFFTMTYEAPRPVAHNRAFEAIAPMLWLKAGSQGRRIDKAADDFDVADTYGVLFDMDASHEFFQAVGKTESIRMAFIVTDDERSYQMVCSELPTHVEPVRLYESYLTNFTINTGRE
ncbi:site-specific DNA-methyltransferase [Nonomuraea wenchangensis]|uniref:site-specific DNA-methyltransferase n=1 Tax=Nonomuraea wenchangensis TaxID=568860 RepID=UPI003711C011